MEKIKRRVVNLMEQDNVIMQRLRSRFLKEKVIARDLRCKNLARSKNHFIIIDYGRFWFVKH